MNTEYRRYIVKVGTINVQELDDINEAMELATKVAGFVFDNYEFAIIFRA